MVKTGDDSKDYLVASFTPDGQTRFVHRFPTGTADRSDPAIDVADSGAIAIVGTLKGSVNFGGPLLSSTNGVPSRSIAVGSEVFVPD